MSKLTKSDLYQALFPIYHLSKVLGLLPVRLVRQRSDRYIGSIYIIDIVYSVCLLVFFSVAEVWGLWRDLRDGWENSTRLKHQTALNITIGDVTAVALLAAAGVLGAPFRWKYIREMMARLIHADERLGFTTPKKTQRFAIILSSCTMIFFIALACLDIYSWDLQTKMKRKMPDKGPINYSPLYFFYFQALLIEIQYTIATYNLNQRFVRLNKNLENLLKSSKNYLRRDIDLVSELSDKDKFPMTILRSETSGGSNKHDRRLFRTPKISGWTESRDVMDTVSQLITIHSSLCDVNILINKAFGLPMLVVAITALFHLIITPYFLLMEATSDKETLFIIVQCLWCGLHVFRVVVVVQPCYSTTNESQKTAILASQLLTYSWQPEIRKQLEIFSLQLLHRPLHFTACGLFSLDRALITSMAGAVTTYLVILIQFQKADDTKDTNNILKNATLLLRNVSTTRTKALT
ncbi:gustatory receptor for sugar taste 43a-like isoform X2 [Microplitis mediator]|uniref:gustatory receptor for sugar taste 43a-like isoform X2 n=1 Tax=Microplitis mediator TaxID=375433 RepID=UPI002553633B|nr:gustatory receptor for sugar taste 43a-like isoform X2 [Microplitis mediator]